LPEVQTVGGLGFATLFAQGDRLAVRMSSRFWGEASPQGRGIDEMRTRAARITSLALGGGLVTGVALVGGYAMLHGLAESQRMVWAGFAGLTTVLVVLVGVTLHLVRPTWRDLRRQSKELKRRGWETSRELEERVEAAERHAHELEQSVDDLRRFAYAASHDLKEPIRTVVSHLQSLEQRHGDELDDDAREHLDYAVDGGKRLAALLDGLLAYAQVGTEGEPFDRVDLDVVLEDVRDSLRARIDETEARVQVDSLPAVFGDRTQLARLFQNLLGNAIKFAGDQPPSVEIRANRDHDDWVIEVEDEGLGFDAETEQRLFEMFQRAHSDVEGTGVGLAICQRIVDRHHGQLSVSSSPGEGATFRIRLPVAEEQQTPPEPRELGETTRTLEERTRELI